MNELLDKIFRFLQATWKRQRYEYRFMSFRGNEENKQIMIANSIEYEFINSGSTYIIINNQFTLYPAFLGIEPSRQKFTINKNEQDVTVYNYEFRAVQAGDPCLGVNTTPEVWNNILTAYKTTSAVSDYNLLQVVIKQPSTQK